MREDPTTSNASQVLASCSALVVQQQQQQQQQQQHVLQRQQHQPGCPGGLPAQEAAPTTTQ
jgi:hypothetical protein